MIGCTETKISDLTDIVMQPEIALRQSADWMVEKGLVEYANADTLKLTDKGTETATKMQELAIKEESALLSQIPAEQAGQFKANLKTLIDKLS